MYYFASLCLKLKIDFMLFINPSLIDYSSFEMVYTRESWNVEMEREPVINDIVFCVLSQIEDCIDMDLILGSI